MVRKAPSKKGGIDFKKIRRKIGRKLQPPNNATNTEIKSKAIILPEQSVASDKLGLAVSKKGLTLKELLQQTSHHNQKVRRDALHGVRDLISNHPAELRTHKYALVEKLRERISDDDKMVREAVYQLFKTIILPKSKEDNQCILVSSMMTHIFCAMTHLEIDIRMMAFKFLDLIIQNFPSCFSTYAEEVVQSYDGLLRNKKFYVQEKGKLKHALAGLLHFLSLLPDDAPVAESSINLNSPGGGVLHAFESQARKDYLGFSNVIRKLKYLVPTLVNSLQELTPSAQSMELLDVQSFDCMLYMLQSIDKSVRFLKYGEKIIQNDLKDQTNDDEDASTFDEYLPILSKKVFTVFPLSRTNYESGKDDDKYFVLNVAISEIFLHIGISVQLPGDLLDKFLDFIEHALNIENGGVLQPKKKFIEKHIILLLNSIPKLVSQVNSIWKNRLLEAFTAAFRGCCHESATKLACLSAIEEMLVPRCGLSCMDTNDPNILVHYITWMRELPWLILRLGDKYPSACKILLHLQLRIGHCALVNPSIAHEYDNMQYSLMEFYSSFSDGVNQYGPFTRISPELQELSVSCLYYYSVIDSRTLESLVACCLCPHLKSSILLRIIEVIQSSYRAGRVRAADFISFFISLLSRYKGSSDAVFQGKEIDSKISNHGVFRSITNVICSGLSRLGDPSLVLQMLESITVDQISGGSLSVDNMCALLRVLMTLDSTPTKLSEENIARLQKVIAEYLVDVARLFPDESTVPNHLPTQHYYFVPCLLFFHRCQKLCSSVLNTMGSMITNGGHNGSTAEVSSRTGAIVSVLLVINRNDKFHQTLWSCKTEIDSILDKIAILQSSGPLSESVEDKHKMQCLADRLRIVWKHIP